MAADYTDGSRLSELTYEYVRQLHQQVVDNWTKSGADGSEFDVLRVTAVRAVLVVVYVIVIVIGALGNGLVVAVAVCRVSRSSPAAKSSQSATYVFIVCLAGSDLALCVFSLPVQLHYQLTDSWHFGSVLCRVVFAAFAVPMYLSTVTILLIALDRYLLIVRPFGDRLSGRRAVWLVVANLFVSILLAAPVVHYTSLEVVDADPQLGVRRMALCVERWTNGTVRRVYSIFAFLVQFCLPLIATAALYSRIYIRLRLRRQRALSARSANSHSPAPASVVANPFLGGDTSVAEPVSSDRGQASPLPVAGTNVASRTTKTNRILAAIVVNFVVCWLPWNVFGLITELDHRVVRGRHFKLVDLTLKGFAMASACVNPLLYSWLNENLRRDIGILSLRLSLFQRRSHHSRSPAAVGNSDGVDARGGRPGDLPRLFVQPPSVHSSGPGTAPGGTAFNGELIGLPEAEVSTAVSSDSPHNTSLLVVSERFSASSICAFNSAQLSPDRQRKTENTQF